VTVVVVIVLGVHVVQLVMEVCGGGNSGGCDSYRGAFDSDCRSSCGHSGSDGTWCSVAVPGVVPLVMEDSGQMSLRVAWWD